MLQDPVDHLLMSLHNNFGWGDPFEVFDKMDEESNAESADENLPTYHETIKYMNENDMLQQKYHSRPGIHYKKDECSYNFSKENEGPWPDNLFDLLGKYIVDRYDEEGKIYLFEDCISKVGEKYFIESGLNLKKGKQYFINIVREIVLWHELGHWITHWMTGNDNCRWNLTESYIINGSTKDTHEGLAQAFTFYAIIKIYDQNQRNNYLQVFNYMLRDQASCYHKHYEIMNHPNFSWKGLLRGIKMLRIKENPEQVTIDNLVSEMPKILFN
ncbi:MAG: hypothetical protein KKA81_15200 [Bacteroidetes bacterium]|nr:hypothetical protein [Bacteroidota bacterium]